VAETFIEAAFNGADGSEEAHFFLGDQYVTYSFANDRVVDGVRPVSDWGVPSTFTPLPTADTTPEPAGIDAAIKGRDRFAEVGYLFKGTNYIPSEYFRPSAAARAPQQTRQPAAPIPVGRGGGACRTSGSGAPTLLPAQAAAEGRRKSPGGRGAAARDSPLDHAA
jgi:hypothetical protein